MTTPQRYPKPCITNMPCDVGLQVFKEILSSSPPDPVKMIRELDEYERRRKGKPFCETAVTLSKMLMFA